MIRELRNEASLMIRRSRYNSNEINEGEKLQKKKDKLFFGRLQSIRYLWITSHHVGCESRGATTRLTVSVNRIV